MYAIYETATGILKSTGTVLAENMPETLAVVELNQLDSEKLSTGAGIWDTQTLTVIDNPAYQSPADDKTIPVTALEQLKSDMEDPSINSIAEVKTAIKSFVDLIG